MWLRREPRLAQLVEQELWMQRALLRRPKLQVRVQLGLQVLQAQLERRVRLLQLLSRVQQVRVQRLQLRLVLQHLPKLPCSH